MSSVLPHLPQLFESYKTWVSANPQLGSDFETSAKWISYFIAGKINSSHVLSELVYCLSNLLVLFNDRIISNVRRLELPSSGDTLKLWLTIVEYCEVLFELASQRVWGNVGKWIVILSIQVFKCISRLVLIHKHKETIIQSPPIPLLERSKVAKHNPALNPANDLMVNPPETHTFTLKSGRVVRKVDGSPGVNFRDWKPLRGEQCQNRQTLEQSLAGRQLVAETIYVCKPIAHLASLAVFGDKSWKAWMVSLVLDIASLQLYESCVKSKINALTPRQRLQVSKRKVMFALYLLRSPFYEKHTRDRLQGLLEGLSDNLPLAQLVCRPLAQYVPFWQSIYFYMWST